eukprot:749910-Hanusia_phi.AAC.3
MPWHDEAAERCDETGHSERGGEGVAAKSGRFDASCQGGSILRHQRSCESSKKISLEHQGTTLLDFDMATTCDFRDQIAYGGQENELQVYDLQSQTVTWKAKNVPENKLRLRLPVWVTDLQYLSSEDENKIVICTAYGQIRLYDIRAQRRPVLNAVCSPVIAMLVGSASQQMEGT